MNRFRVLANMAQSPQEGRNLFAKLTKVTDRFLDVALQYVGAVPYDESVRKAVQKQRAVYEAFPRQVCWRSRPSRRRSTLAAASQPTRAPGVFRRAPRAAKQRGTSAMTASGFKMYKKSAK
jgi:flagellar biosynthesis protein FlhG